MDISIRIDFFPLKSCLLFTFVLNRIKELVHLSQTSIITITLTLLHNSQWLQTRQMLVSSKNAGCNYLYHRVSQNCTFLSNSIFDISHNKFQGYLPKKSLEKNFKNFYAHLALPLGAQSFRNFRLP